MLSKKDQLITQQTYLTYILHSGKTADDNFPKIKINFNKSYNLRISYPPESIVKPLHMQRKLLTYHGWLLLIWSHQFPTISALTCTYTNIHNTISRFLSNVFFLAQNDLFKPVAASNWLHEIHRPSILLTCIRLTFFLTILIISSSIFFSAIWKWT